MRIEQDLRIVIKAAAEVSKKNSSRWESQKARKKAVDDFLAKYPAKRMRVAKLTKDYETASKLAESCEQKLETEFGLCLSEYHGDKICNESAFEKAGGKIPKTSEFTAEQVITKYAAAKTKAEATSVLKEYGIVWA